MGPRPGVALPAPPAAACHDGGGACVCKDGGAAPAAPAAAARLTGRPAAKSLDF